LINDTSSTVIGQVVTDQATGSVIGQLGGVLVMENIDSTARVQINDQVVTAGIDLGNGVRSPFPKGLLIGTVVDDQRDANAVVQTAFIEPAVDLDKLEYVLVITNYQGGLPPVDQQAVPCPTHGATLPAGEQPCVTAAPSLAPSP
jgi:rod shape-determining protein MreC